MHLGLLIQDTSKAPLAVRIGKAQERYQQKYGTPANRVYMNSGEAAQDQAQFQAALAHLGNIPLITKQNILPQCLWLGVEAETETPAPSTVRCPACDKWARQEGNRFYHLEVMNLPSGERVDERSWYCEPAAPELSGTLAAHLEIPPAPELDRFTHTDGNDYLIDYNNEQVIPVNDPEHPLPWGAFQVEDPEEWIAVVAAQLPAAIAREA